MEHPTQPTSGNLAHSSLFGRANVGAELVTFISIYVGLVYPKKIQASLPSLCPSLQSMLPATPGPIEFSGRKSHDPVEQVLGLTNHPQRLRPHRVMVRIENSRVTNDTCLSLPDTTRTGTTFTTSVWSWGDGAGGKSAYCVRVRT